MEKQPTKDNFTKNTAEGLLWGAVLGDVIGAFLEFDCDITQEKINKAFTICGGGKHHLQSGQPTDDSQLGYAVGKGLKRGKGVLNLNMIAEEMANWFLSKPIDIGGTIRKSIPKACNMKEHQAYLCRKGATEGSLTSQSNGTLMAITTLGVWAHKLPPEKIIEAVRQYTILVHPSEVVVYTNSFYILVISYLINHFQEENRNYKAYNFAKQYICTLKNIQFNKWIDTIDKSLEDKQYLLKQVPANKKAGWVRIAFSYSIYYLLKGTSYKQSIHQIIALKGDTDTNSCIAGGLLGAYYGLNNLQMDQQIQKIRLWRPKKVKRPDWMVPGLVVNNLVQKLLQLSPTQLVMIGSQRQYKQKKTNK